MREHWKSSLGSLYERGREGGVESGKEMDEQRKRESRIKRGPRKRRRTGA